MIYDVRLFEKAINMIIITLHLRCLLSCQEMLGTYISVHSDKEADELGMVADEHPIQSNIHDSNIYDMESITLVLKDRVLPASDATYIYH